MKTTRLIVEVLVEGVTVAEAKRALARKLGCAAESVSYAKGTLPDPDTVRQGVIYWGTAVVKQRKRRD